MLTAEEDRAKALGLKPIGQILGFSWAACSPENRWESVVRAVDKLLSRHVEADPFGIGDVEILADSAATTLAISEGLVRLGIQPSAINPNGSSLVWGVNEGGDGVLAASRALLHENEPLHTIPCDTLYSALPEGKEKAKLLLDIAEVYERVARKPFASIEREYHLFSWK